MRTSWAAGHFSFYSRTVYFDNDAYCDAPFNALQLLALVPEASVIPIHELLARIRWDPEFGRGRFEIGYIDRKEKRLVRVALERITTIPGGHFSFEAIEDDGSVHTVPYRRVRAVWCDGQLLWSRSSLHRHL